MTAAELLADVRAHALLYASMPLVAAAIGYATKRVAIRMMFQPLEFRGLPPWLGWQGVVPRNAARMAAIACDTITSRLLTQGELLERLDLPGRLPALAPALARAVDEVTRDCVREFQPGLWESLAEPARALIVRQLQAEAQQALPGLLPELRRGGELIDLRAMVVRRLTRDKALLNRIFLESGAVEFRFIARSGLYFGFVIGCVQAATWALTHSPLIMPLFGGLTGWLTDWLALNLVFRPRQPRRVLGLFEWQGLFLRRRREVSARYAALVAQEVLTPRALLDELAQGPAMARLEAATREAVAKLLDAHKGPAKAFLLALGPARYAEFKAAAATRLVERLRRALPQLEPLVAEALDLRAVLTERMQALSEAEFEQLLRPAFRQDEWKLIAVGAVLGFLVGELQAQVMIAAR